MDMELNLTETRSRITKTLTATAENYSLTANAVIEDGKIVSMSGNVTDTTEMIDTPAENIFFEGRRVNNELKVNYHNIAADERETIDIISAMVDAVVARYEE
jgi:hypothetical protein